MTFAVFKVIGVLVSLRVRQEDEVMSLVVSLHGEALQ
jgi:ammonia channel protein AmtB